VISAAHLLVIAFDVDIPAVVKLVRDHAVACRSHPGTYSTAEVAVLAEAVRWRRTDPRPPVPTAFAEALTEALHREIPGTDLARARRLAEGCIVQATALRSSAR